MPSNESQILGADLPPVARAYLLHLSTSLFDVAAEPANDINPIPGQAALAWLGGALLELGFDVTEPGTEDWGWYIEVHRDGASWIVGASGDQASGALYDWTIQVVKHRSMLQVLRGKERMGLDDDLFVAVHDVFAGTPGIQLDELSAG